MSTTFTRTREQIGAIVLNKLGVLSSGETADSNDLTIVYQALDLRLKELFVLGLQYWKLSPAATTITMTASTTSFALPSDFNIAHTLTIQDSNLDILMEVISHEDYARISDKSAVGFPQKAHIDVTNKLVYLWPLPNTLMYGKLTYEKIVDDTASSTAPNIPVELMRSLADVVARDVAFSFDRQSDLFERDARVAEQNISVFMALRMNDSKKRLEYF